MRTERKQFRLTDTKFAALCVAALLLLASCTKNAVKVDVDNNKIPYVIADNFNLSQFNVASKRSGVDILLKGQGPFTVLVPSNQAFTTAGYATGASILTANGATISRLMYYHIMDGKFDVNALPLKFNQEITSRGNKYYVTRWIKGLDTVVTFNGVRITSKNVPASNGLMQFIGTVLTPYTYDKLGDALGDDVTMTLFYQAVVSAGMLSTINGTGPYTLFAPDNAAMVAAGYTTLDQVSKTDPAVLRKLVNGHLALDRHFINDYILISDATNTTTQTMMDGNTASITLKVNPSVPGGFGGIWLKEQSNPGNIELDKQNISTGNGVLHSILGILKN